jgi:lysyl-tRNA synthetase class 2
MEDLNEQRKARLDNLTRLRELGVNPYPYRFTATHDA